MGGQQAAYAAGPVDLRLQNGVVSEVGDRLTATDADDVIEAALDQTSRLQEDSSKLQQRFQMEDPTVGLEETVIAMQKANLGFQAVVQARNKLVAAYTEIMNMNV